MSNFTQLNLQGSNTNSKTAANPPTPVNKPMDNDTVGVAERTLQQVRTWPPGLPIFGLLTPLPATPLYKRLEAAGRLTRPKHWREFIPFAMAHTPLKMTIEEAHAEVRYGWNHAYSPEAIAHGNFTRVCYHGRNVAFSFEFGITLSLMHLHRETENRFIADHVAFTHQPDDIHEMEQVLNCQVRANSSWNGFAFTRESGRLPLRRGDAILHHVLERQAAEIAARLPKQDGVVSEVRRVLAARLSQGEIQIENVARELATSVRSLQRRLAEAKISYQQLVDDTRREAADTYLNNKTLSIGEVAYLLGYSEPAAFHRAFKRWQGITPQVFRQQYR